jgi:hypothetical protein
MFVPCSTARHYFICWRRRLFNYGISGKSKYTVTYTVPGGDDIVESEKVDAFKKEQDGGAGLKKTDYGISALAGIQFGKLFANVGYQLSLANIAEAEVGEYKNGDCN